MSKKCELTGKIPLKGHKVSHVNKFDIPTEVIPNGCELETISEIPDQVRIPGTGDRVRIQFIGRMDRNHTFAVLILVIQHYRTLSKLAQRATASTSAVLKKNLMR